MPGNMVEKILGVRRFAGESFELYSRRKNRSISASIPFRSRWSYVWAGRVVSWDQHVQRNTAQACWAARVASHRSASELADRRAANPSGRPDVRVLSGYTSARLSESTTAAYAYVARSF